MGRNLITAAAVFFCLFLAGAQERIVFESEFLHCNDTVLVFSPSHAAKDTPTLFLLHGFGGKYSNWASHANLQAISNSSGFRIICPDGFASSWYLDNVNPSEMQWRSFFWKECWPSLAKRYGLDPSRTFIDGLSMGGHGAMNLFLDHPERFRGAGSMSGVLALQYTGGSKVLIPKILGVESILDPAVAAQSAVNRLDRLAGFPDKIILISCGTEDRLLVASQEFERRCAELGIKHITLYSPGLHNWSYWVWLLPYHLQFFAEAL